MLVSFMVRFSAVLIVRLFACPFRSPSETLKAGNRLPKERDRQRSICVQLSATLRLADTTQFGKSVIKRCLSNHVAGE